MALSFLTSSDATIEVVVSCDPEVKADSESVSKYLQTGDLSELENIGNATKFTLKALSPSEREAAEVKAGAMTRSELGRLLWVEAPTDTKERARWHHALSDDEREAMSQYNSYLNRVYIEMIRAGLTLIDGEAGSVDDIQQIRPDAHRAQTISELVLHLQRISLLGTEGK